MKQAFRDLKYVNGIIMAQPVVQQEREWIKRIIARTQRSFTGHGKKKAYSRLIPYFVYRIKYVFIELGKAIMNHT